MCYHRYNLTTTRTSPWHGFVLVWWSCLSCASINEYTCMMVQIPRMKYTSISQLHIQNEGSIDGCGKSLSALAGQRVAPVRLFGRASDCWLSVAKILLSLILNYYGHLFLTYI
jgi:hypothetical protein